MRVAFVTNVVFPFIKGGAQKRIYEIGTRLAADGHEVTVYSRHFWDGPEDMVYEGMRLRSVAPDTDLYVGDRRSIKEALDFATRAFSPLRRRLQRDEHDVIVACVFPYFPILTTKAASLGTGTPLITTWHEVWGDYWKEYLGFVYPFGKFTERITARTPQYPIAVSNITADCLATIGPSRESIRVVPNGIDLKQITTASIPTKSYNILFVGRLMEHKNIDILLEAFDKVVEKYDATLGIIGDGPEREYLEAKHNSLSHPDRIEFLGFVDEYEEVIGQMHAADIFVSPSTREGFGITLLEAMAADCTVIAADCPNSAANEVIQDAGFCVDPTIESLSEVLNRALRGERPASNPVDQARQYDWDEIAHRARDAYRAAVEGTW